MVNNQIKEKLAMLGFNNASEVFENEGKDRGWTYLCHSEVGPIVFPQPSELSWVFFAIRSDTLVWTLKRVTLILEIRSARPKDTSVHVRRSWDCIDLCDRGLPIPGRTSMLAELLSECPLPLLPVSFGYGQVENCSTRSPTP